MVPSELPELGPGDDPPKARSRFGHRDSGPSRWTRTRPRTANLKDSDSDSLTPCRAVNRDDHVDREDSAQP